MAAAAIGVGAGMGLIGGIMAGNAAMDAAEANAQGMRMSAEQTKIQTEEDLRKQKMIALKSIGSSRAAVGASGIQMTGSALDVLEESAANAERDAQFIKRSGENQVRAYEFGASAELNRGRQARDAAYMGGAASAIGGVGSFMGRK